VHDGSIDAVMVLAAHGSSANQHVDNNVLRSVQTVRLLSLFGSGGSDWLIRLVGSVARARLIWFRPRSFYDPVSGVTGSQLNTLSQVFLATAIMVGIFAIP